MSDGAFSAPARAAIYEAGGGRCVGCGSAQVTAQHRRARGMGGTSREEIGYAVNGVPLCGDGVRGCHGWTEHNPDEADLLGWRLTHGQDWTEPWWTRFGWRRWVIEDGMPLVAYVDEADLDRLAERRDAVAEYGERAA